MDTGIMKNLRRIQQKANQNLGRAEKTEVVTDDLHNVEQRVEHMIDSLHHAKQKLADCMRSKSKEDNPEKRKKKLVEYHFAQALLNDSKNLEDELKESLLGEILGIYGGGMLTVVDELVQSELNIEKRIFEHLSKYGEDAKNVQIQKEKMKKAVLDMDSARSRLVNAKSKAENYDSLQDESDVCWNKVDSCKDNWALELYTLAGKEIDMANIFLILVKLQLDFYRTAYKTLDDLLPSIQTKIDQYPRRPVYGCPLSDHLRYSNREIAIVLEVCCSGLSELGLREEGLFRIPGLSQKIKKLKASFDIDEIDLTDLENHPHAIAGALKLYLRELPDPLMTHNLYSDWIKSVTNYDDTESRLKAIKDVIAKLPEPNYANLRYLVKFLSKLCENQQYTKMNSQALSTVMTPNMLWNPNNEEGFGGNISLVTLVDCLISNADYFFPGDIRFNSNRLSKLINMTGGFVDNEGGFVGGQRNFTNSMLDARSRSPSTETVNSGQFNQPNLKPVSIVQPQPVRRPKPPKPPAPPPPKSSVPPTMHSSVGVADVDDPIYEDVADSDEDVKIEPNYSVPNKREQQQNRMVQSSTPPDDPVVAVETAAMSTSLIRTPSENQSTGGGLVKTHRKTNSLDRPARPPRFSLLDNNIAAVVATMNPADRERTSSIGGGKREDSQKLQTVNDEDEENRTDQRKHHQHPNRPPLPSREVFDKHSVLQPRHSSSLSLKIGGGASGGIVVSKHGSPPTPTSTHHTTNVEVEPPDEADDADMDWVTSDGCNAGASSLAAKQAPIVAFRRNLFENNNKSLNVEVNNGSPGASSTQIVSNGNANENTPLRHSAKKKPAGSGEKSPNAGANGAAAAPPRPKPPVPSKPRSSAEVDDNMTRL